MITYRFRIKDSTHLGILNRKASAVNYVWNYCNSISKQSANRRFDGGNNSWITEYDLNYLTTGSSKELGLSSTTIQAITAEFINKRNIKKTPKLRWRSYKKNLGWIPFKSNGIQLKNDTIVYLGRKFKFWKSREIKGKLRTGCFSQDSEGHWYINLTCESESLDPTNTTKIIGIDLGLKILATCSDGTLIENPKISTKYSEKLTRAQRANKKKQVRKIHTKIKNIRKDFLHKTTTELVSTNKQIFIGNVNSSTLIKTKMAKSVLDASWGMFKNMLKYKAIRLGVDFQIIDEKYSTVTCSNCYQRTGPSGLSSLGIRDWECSLCGSQHQRDVNAAKNILCFALGHESPWGSHHRRADAKCSINILTNNANRP
jgi:IS605 OrfB family transposase